MFCHLKGLNKKQMFHFIQHHIVPLKFHRLVLFDISVFLGLSAVEEQDAVNYEDIEEDMQRTFKTLNPQAAVNMLSQFRGQGEVVDFVLINEEGLQHDPR